MSDDLEYYRWLRRTAVETQQRTDRELPGVAERWPRAIECLLKLAGFLAAKDQANPDTYEAWIARSFISAAQSFFAAYELWRSGSYVEAEVLHRHLLETLAQVHYFASRHADFEVHLYAGMGLSGPPPGPSAPSPPAQSGAKKPQATKFKTIFDAIVPGYYDTQYRTDSSFAHGGAMVVASRFGTKNLIRPEFAYKDEAAGAVINKLTALLYGYIQQALHSFPATQLDANTTALVARVTKELDEMLVPDPSVPVEHQDWLKLIGPLIHRP